MKIKRSDGAYIEKKHMIKCTQMGNITEVMYMRSKPSEMPFKKLDADNYMIIKTGEIKPFNHATNRADSLENLRESFKLIRNTINANFTGHKNERHITLTYAENMTDTKKLYKDVQKFWKRFLYAYPGSEYIQVIEAQDRGAWHVHLLVKLQNDIFIANNKTLAPMWSHGFTKIKSLNGVDNIGAYLSAYLGDIELLENQLPKDGQKIFIKEVDGEKKGYIKGGRLHLYPKGIQIMRKSKGIKPPTVTKMKYEQIKSVVGTAIPNYTQTIEIFDDDDKHLNTIIYEQYNTKRSKKSKLT